MREAFLWAVRLPRSRKEWAARLLTPAEQQSVLSGRLRGACGNTGRAEAVNGGQQKSLLSGRLLHNCTSHQE